MTKLFLLSPKRTMRTATAPVFTKEFCMCSFVMLALLLLTLINTSFANATEHKQEQHIDFPHKDITVVVPFSRHGGADITMRMLAQVSAQYLQGKALVVKNIPGEGGLVGQAEVASTKNDGYTLLSYTNSIIANPLFKEAPYTSEDFIPLLMFCFDPQVLVVPASSPYTDLQHFLREATEKRMRLVTPGHSTAHHLTSLAFEKHFGFNFSYIHTTSGANQAEHLVNKYVSAAFMTYGEAAKYIQGGSLRALGIMSNENYDGAESIPHFSSVGFTSEWGSFRGVGAPKDTPEHIVQFLKKNLLAMSQDANFIHTMKKAGYPHLVLNDVEFIQFIDQHEDALQKLKPLLHP